MGIVVNSFGFYGKHNGLTYATLNICGFALFGRTQMPTNIEPDIGKLFTTNNTLLKGVVKLTCVRFTTHCATFTVASVRNRVENLTAQKKKPKNE